MSVGTPALEAGRVMIRQSITEQMAEQQLPFEKDIDFSTEAIAPRVTKELRAFRGRTPVQF